MWGWQGGGSCSAILVLSLAAHPLGWQLLLCFTVAAPLMVLLYLLRFASPIEAAFITAEDSEFVFPLLPQELIQTAL